MRSLGLGVADIALPGGSVHFETGVPVEFPFAHNTTASPRPGPRDQFQQKLEPAGYYVVPMWQDSKYYTPTEELGIMYFQNPLVLEFNDPPQRYAPYDETSWKARLTKAFRARGKRLSEKLRQAGYDGVVTVKTPNDVKEIVSLAQGYRPNARTPTGRDPELEQQLSKRHQQLLDRYERAYYAAGRAGRIRWKGVYELLATDPTAEPELVATIHELEQAAPKAERVRRERREQERYEKQALELEAWPRDLRRYLGRDVWLYHGTSSAILPIVLEYGLQPEDVEQAEPEATSGYVYLTARPVGPASAETYANRAAAVFGGDPVILRVIVPFDELEPDEDDADIASGSYQFRTPYVVTRIMEVDGRRVS